jgi:hypothetical protein
MIGLLVAVAAALVGIVALDATAPASCGDADAARSSGLLSQAEQSYRRLLRDEPDRGCALAGLKAVTAALCRRADRLREAGLDGEARTLYASIIGREPPTGSACAKQGSAKLPKDPSTHTTTVAGPPGADGAPGKPGADGAPGKPGADGHDARGGISLTIVVCHDRKACRWAG